MQLYILQQASTLDAVKRRFRKKVHFIKTIKLPVKKSSNVVKTGILALLVQANQQFTLKTTVKQNKLFMRTNFQVPMHNILLVTIMNSRQDLKATQQQRFEDGDLVSNIPP
jgi:hypothetical protein